MSEPSSEASNEQKQSETKGHPRGLYVLFFAEMWERFSFYGMRALLNLYLTKAQGFSKPQAYGVYGAYGALVYAFPVIGGLLADKLLGHQLAVVIGGALMALGHLVMTSEALPALFTALALLCVGNGFFKPNISTIVGKLYEEGDPRRDSGFTIFYMGINLGAALGQTLCGLLGEKVGWHWGFGLATIGMIAGLIVFVSFRELLHGHGRPPSREALLERKRFGCNALTLVMLAVLVVVPVCAIALWKNQVVSYALYGTGAIVLFFLLGMALKSDNVWRDRMFLVLVLMVFHVIFWAFFEQAGSSLTLFADEHVDRNVFGWEPTASQVGALNPIYIIMFAPLFAKLWTSLQRANRDPSIPIKFSLGLLQIGPAFGLLVLGASLVPATEKTHLVWLALCYLLQTTGELCLSPVGLSAVTKLALPRSVGWVMGAWFLTIAFAHNVAAILAKLTASGGAAGETIDAATRIAGYTGVFSTILWVALGVGVLLVLLSFPLKRLAHGVR